MRWQIEPMDRWPYPETKPRKSSPFSASWQDTLDLLERELDALRVTSVVAVRVVGSASDVRRDGMLRANVRLAHPGVAVSFQSKYGPLSYPCDTFETGPSWTRRGQTSDWQVNVRAVALALEALRKVDRYGVTRRGEQYTGWRAIEAPGSPGFGSADEALRWLRQLVDVPGAEGLSAALLLRTARSQAHPDRNGGDRSLWDRVEAAVALLTKDGRL
jgi:hypothetical protein